MAYSSRSPVRLAGVATRRRVVSPPPPMWCDLPNWIVHTVRWLPCLCLAYLAINTNHLATSLGELHAECRHTSTPTIQAILILPLFKFQKKKILILRRWRSRVPSPPCLRLRHWHCFLELPCLHWHYCFSEHFQPVLQVRYIRTQLYLRPAIMHHTLII